MDIRTAARKRGLTLATPSDLGAVATKDIAAALTALLAAVFALHLKTKNFNWHFLEPHFRDYHLLLDEQSDPLFAMTRAIAERARKIGGPILCALGSCCRLAAAGPQRCGIHHARRHVDRAAIGQWVTRPRPKAAV